MSIATQRSIEDIEAQHNVEKVKEHMVDEEIKNLVEGTGNENVDAFMDDVLNSQEDLGTRIEPRSDKESPEMKKDAGMAARDEFELRRRERGKGIEDIKDTPLPTLIRSPRTYISPLSIIRRHSRN
ncbi:hypothetical protein Tco_1206465 [Tanacetum coccineum]